MIFELNSDVNMFILTVRQMIHVVIQKKDASRTFNLLFEKKINKMFINIKFNT